MATSREYYAFIAEQFSDSPEVTFRPMMGEYVVYCQGKVIGGIYDGRFLVKPLPAAKSRMPEAPLVCPYPGAKALLLVENVEDRVFLRQLALALSAELPEPKARKKRSSI